MPSGVVDSLFRVRLRSGGDAWLLIHVEVQAQRDAAFERRMFVYHYRIIDRHERAPVSLAVLADDERSWRPRRYAHGALGCALSFEFPAVKLLDYAERQEELEASGNPFALAVLAHLQTQRTRAQPVERVSFKGWLQRALLRRGYEPHATIAVFDFIDWIMALPAGLQREHEAAMGAALQEAGMPYMNVWTREGWEKGRQEGQPSRRSARWSGPSRRGSVRCPMRWWPGCARSMTSNGWTRCTARP